MSLHEDAVLLARRLGMLGAERVILFGSLALKSRETGPDSDVDLVVVMPGVEGQRFHKRLEDILAVTDFPHPVDLLVYSPGEWESVSARSFFRSEVLGKGEVLFERSGRS